jgi:hypothetical protein
MKEGAAPVPAHGFHESLNDHTVVFVHTHRFNAPEKGDNPS